MTSSYEELIPKNAILFNLRQVEEMGLIKVDMAKKLIAKRKLEIVKVGSKIHISRLEIVRYLKENTIAMAVEEGEL
jgi:hypothetical protein